MEIFVGRESSGVSSGIKVPPYTRISKYRTDDGQDLDDDSTSVAASPTSTISSPQVASLGHSDVDIVGMDGLGFRWVGETGMMARPCRRVLLCPPTVWHPTSLRR